MRYLLIIILIILSIIGQIVLAQYYPVSDISDELKINTHLIIRKDLTHFEVKNELNAVENRKIIVTVCSKTGEEMNTFSLFYDKQSPISKCYAVLYDKNGNKKESFKTDDFVDHSAVSGFNLYDDTRAKSIKIIGNSFPYTMEINYTQVYKGFISFPPWIPAAGEKIAVESSEYIITIPKDYQIRYKEFNLKHPVEVISDEKTSTYRWELNNLPAIPDEPYKPHHSTYRPMVLLTPVYYNYYNSNGSFETWESFGKWEYSLIQDRDQLPPEAIMKVKELTDGITCNLEKIKILYKYLQSTTRYVSIQLGIGGFQPFDAATVYKYGYGDCKALSNYMKALLKEAGIYSIYTAIKAGNNGKIFLDFPCQQFNHVILCVPVEKDTIWLECTNQSNPFGYMGRFTGNRPALLITENGGKIVQTPEYHMDVNRQIMKTEVNCNPENNLVHANVILLNEGLQYERFSVLENISKPEQEKHLLMNLEISDINISNFSVTYNKKPCPSSVLTIDMELYKYLSISNDRIFLPINLLNRLTYVPKKLSERQTDVFIQIPYIDKDTVTFTMPEGYIVEYFPEPKEITTSFGTYSAKIDLIDDKLRYVRELQMKSGLFPRERYEELVNFRNEITKADNAKVLLRKQ